jgi:hypothetical protein
MRGADAYAEFENVMCGSVDCRYVGPVLEEVVEETGAVHLTIGDAAAHGVHGARYAWCVQG